MENAKDTMRLLRSLKSSCGSRSEILAVLIEATQLWRQTRSLAAYHLVMSALDSNDDEIRRMAEESLNRRSPRPITRRV